MVDNLGVVCIRMRREVMVMPWYRQSLPFGILVSTSTPTCDVTMRTHVTDTVRACFAALRQIRSVRRSLPC